MKLSIIIVNYNQKYFPRLCIEAIKNSKLRCEYEIIVVDNASDPDDLSIKWLKEAEKKGEIILIESNSNLGYGKGNNLGAKIAKGEYLLIMNPDIFVNADTIEKMIEYMGKNPKVGVMGPKLVYADGSIQESCRRHMNFFDLLIKRTFLKKIPIFKKRLNHYLMKDYCHFKEKDVDILCGACFIFPKKVFEKADGFDERYFLFMEDFDLCRKIFNLGYRVVYYPEAVALHNHKRLSDGGILNIFNKKIFWIHLISAIKYFLKWRSFN